MSDKRIGRKIKSLEDLYSQSLSGGCVIRKSGMLSSKPCPAAFVMSMQAHTVRMLINGGMWSYVPKSDRVMGAAERALGQDEN